MATSKLGKILDKIIPSDSSHFVEQRKLLWTNASPASTFAAQTVSIDLTGYDKIIIEFLSGNDSVGVDSYFMETTVGLGWWMTYPSDWLLRRRYNVSSTGIVFGDCYRYGTYSVPTSGVVHAELLTPMRVYGIKKLGG